MRVLRGGCTGPRVVEIEVGNTSMAPKCFVLYINWIVPLEEEQKEDSKFVDAGSENRNQREGNKQNGMGQKRRKIK